MKEESKVLGGDLDSDGDGSRRAKDIKGYFDLEEV